MLTATGVAAICARACAHSPSRYLVAATVMLGIASLATEFGLAIRRRRYQRNPADSQPHPTAVVLIICTALCASAALYLLALLGPSTE